MLHTYIALARMAFQRQFAYRAANLAGLATNLFFGALRAYLLIALFNARGAEHVAGYSVQAAVTYTGLSQALISYLALFSWWDVIRSIRTGEVATDLARPVDYVGYWCAQDLGRAAAQILWRGLPMMALYALAYRIVLPPTPQHWLALVVALVLALLVSFGWRFLVSLAAFWTQDAVGLGRLAWTASWFLSGFLMPIAFFPPWMTALMMLTPFPAMVSAPVEIYLGLLDGRELLAALGMQAMWAALLFVVCQLVLAAGVRKLVIQGG
jgi:ABC-2 type transport system permease protein